MAMSTASPPTPTVRKRTSPCGARAVSQLRGLGHDQVRELGDGEHEDEVEVQLDPGDALALFVHQPRWPRPRSRPARAEVPS